MSTISGAEPQCEAVFAARSSALQSLESGRLAVAFRHACVAQELAAKIDDKMVSMADAAHLRIRDQIDHRWSVAAGGPVRPAADDDEYGRRAALLDEGNVATAAADRLEMLTVAQRRNRAAKYAGATLAREMTDERRLEERSKQEFSKMEALASISRLARQEGRLVRALASASDAIDILRARCGKTHGQSNEEEAYSDAAEALDKVWTEAALNGLDIRRSGHLSLVSTLAQDDEVATWLALGPLQVPGVEEMHEENWHLHRLIRAGLIAEGSATVVAYAELYASVPHVSAEESSIVGAKRQAMVREAVEAKLMTWSEAKRWWNVEEQP